MVMAPRTTSSQSKESFCSRSQYIIKTIKFCRLLVVWFIVPDTKPIKAGSYETFVPTFHEWLVLIKSFKDELVPRQLLKNKTVIRLVRVKCFNNVITISPGIWFFVIPLIAIGLSVSDHIQPVAPPPFPVFGHGQ